MRRCVGWRRTFPASGLYRGRNTPGYRIDDKPSLAYVQIVGTNVTDLSDLWGQRSSEALREVLRDELLIVAALLHSLGETFTPGGIGGYRSVDTA